MKVVDLFAGCGGLSLGFQQQGFEIVGAFELWDTAVKCYRENFKHPVYQTDLSNVAEAVKQIQPLCPDIIIGGPPCQDFSQAGKRVEANKAILTDAFAEIVSTIRPYCFVMENVDRVVKSKAYSNSRRVFKDAGYGLTEVILDASLCGTPQKRKRFICFGMQGSQDGFAADDFISAQSNKPMTLREYFGNTLGFEYYYRHPRNYCRRAVFSIDEPAPTMRGVNRPIPKGYPGHPKDACTVSKKLHVLTTSERALIQTFPAEYKWIGSKTDLEQMIGNAVPVNLAQFVARIVKRTVEAKKMIEVEQFKDWLKANTTYSEAVIFDIVSRIRRADSILTWDDNEVYQFYLEHNSVYKSLSSSVRSQLKKAVKLYRAYHASTVS